MTTEKYKRETAAARMLMTTICRKLVFRIRGQPTGEMLKCQEAGKRQEMPILPILKDQARSRQCCGSQFSSSTMTESELGSSWSQSYPAGRAAAPGERAATSAPHPGYQLCGGSAPSGATLRAPANVTSQLAPARVRRGPERARWGGWGNGPAWGGAYQMIGTTSWVSLWTPAGLPQG